MVICIFSLLFPSLVYGQFTVDKCINSITIHCDTCEGLWDPWTLVLSRAVDSFFKVDLLREKIEMFLKLDLFVSTAMDLHIGLGYNLIWSPDGVRELALYDKGK